MIQYNKIFICGSHGVGKTTLLDSIYEDSTMIEQGISKYTKITSLSRGILSLSIDTQNSDYIKQSLITQSYFTKFYTTDCFVSDRSLLDTLAYTMTNLPYEHNFIKYLGEIIERCKNLGNPVYFYIKPEFDIEDDGFRDLNKGYQKKIDIKIDELFTKFDIKKYILTGSVEDRLSQFKLVVL